MQIRDVNKEKGLVYVNNNNNTSNSVNVSLSEDDKF